MKELERVSTLVEKILKTDKRARQDDEYLIYKVVELRNKEFANKSFKEVMLHAKDISLNVDSIRRARQKLQANNKDLKDYDVAEYRKQSQKDYIEFVIEDR